MAIIQGHRAVADYLADAAKGSNATLPPPSPSTGAKRQRTCSSSMSTMGKAAEEGDLARVREAVEEGEDVNQADPARVRTVAVS